MFYMNFIGRGKLLPATSLLVVILCVPAIYDVFNLLHKCTTNIFVPCVQIQGVLVSKWITYYGLLLALNIAAYLILSIAFHKYNSFSWLVFFGLFLVIISSTAYWHVVKPSMIGHFCDDTVGKGINDEWKRWEADSTCFNWYIE